MSQIKVITTETTVYTTFYKTIHFKKDYTDLDSMRDAQDRAASAAFCLACTDHRPVCEKLELDAKNDGEIFDFLERSHR